MTGNLNMGGNRLIQSYNPVVNHDVVNKESLDAGLATKTDTTTTTALSGRVTTAENNITLLSSTLGNDYYNKTSSDARFKPIA
jgi:hypothetical protein